MTQAPTGIIAPLDFSSIGGPIADAGGVPAIVKVLTDPALLVISFSLLMSDFFDTMGTAMAVAKQGEFLTDDGNVENIKEILICLLYTSHASVVDVGGQGTRFPL